MINNIIRLVRQNNTQKNDDKNDDKNMINIKKIIENEKNKLKIKQNNCEHIFKQCDYSSSEWYDGIAEDGLKCINCNFTTNGVISNLPIKKTAKYNDFYSGFNKNIKNIIIEKQQECNHVFENFEYYSSEWYCGIAEDGLKCVNCNFTTNGRINDLEISRIINYNDFI